MNTSCRVRWEGTLRALSTISVAGSAMGDVDVAPVLDGADEVFIPGTTLTGVLRSLSTNDLQDEFGHQDAISAIRIDDASLITRGPLELRDGVGIDRIRGAAADAVKYTRLVVPGGSEFRFRLTAFVDDADVVNPLIELLTSTDGVPIGGSTSRGQGLVRLDQPVRSVVHMTKRGVLEWLRDEVPSEDAGAVGITPAARDQIELIDIPYEARGPVFVASGAEGLAVDCLPLVTHRNGETRLLIPGSSIKGVLRSHAERIERTVRNIDDPDADLLDQINDHRLEVTNRLFGTARAPEGEMGGRRSAVSVQDCVSQWKCPSDGWDAVADAATAKDPDRLANLRRALDELPKENGEIQAGFHVGLDRWTSAPVDGALYSSLEPCGMRWEPLRLRLDHLWLGNDPLGNAGRFLLLLVLRDLCDGWLAIGHGGWRGHGTIRVKPDDIGLETSRWNANSFAQILEEPDLVQELQKAWCELTAGSAEKGVVQ